MEEKHADNKCSAIRVSGHWKDYPCGAIAKYTYKGRRYCGSHYAMEVNKDTQQQTEEK